MDLNTIKLSDFIVREWYNDELLIPASAAGAAADNSPGPPAATPPPAASTPSPAVTPSIPSSAGTPSIAPPPVQAFRHLGNNRRHVTLLVGAPGSPFLPDNQLAFVTKLLEACHMTLSDVAIVNHAAAPVTISELRQQLQPKIIMLFGVDPAGIRLPINFPLFRPQPYDGCTYLAAPALDQLVPNTDESKLLKSKLWVCLKTIFAV